MDNTPTTPSADELAELRAEVHELRRALDALRATSTVDPVRDTTRDATGDTTGDTTASRRSMLRWAGAAAVGAVGAGAIARPAAADVGYSTAVSTDVGDVVRQRLNGSVSGKNGFQFSTVFGPNSNDSASPAVVAGLTFDAEMPTGLLGYTQVPNGRGVKGISGDWEDGVGVFGEGSRGVVGRSVGMSGIGVDGSGDVAGVRGVGTGAGSLGGSFAGERAALLLPLGGTAPNLRSDAHRAGELEVDGSGDLWWCVAGGSPGKWRKLAGPRTAGAFHAIDPTRVYDSRRPAPSPGRFTGETNRTIDLERNRNLTTGAAGGFIAVPGTAQAAVLSLRIVDPRGTGELEILRAGARSQASAQCAWGPATGSTVVQITTRVAESAKVSVRCRGGGSTHVVIDVVGYYQ